MKLLYTSTLFILILILNISCKNSKKTTFEIESTDQLKLAAHLYPTENKSDPLILLFHQAGFSRGEYLEIAPKLNTLGFQCLAVDQRSGKGVNNVDNTAFNQAQSLGLKTDYVSAFSDLESTLTYAKTKYPHRKIIIWGSSYSASLVYILAAKRQNEIDGLVSFSPGEYFKFENKSVFSFANKIDIPVFITSSKSEENEWLAIKNNVKNPNSHFFIPLEKGKHGSKALWKNNSNNFEYWSALEKFLNQFK